MKISTAHIDSILANVSYSNPYHYGYGDGEGTFEDFKMDTINGKLLTYTLTQRLKETFQVEYLFIDNYMVKVISREISKKGVKQIGTYYLANNKTSLKIGHNINLKGNKTFGKINPKLFDRQLEHIYYQYEYLNPNRKRLNENVPDLLKAQQNKIDRPS